MLTGSVIVYILTMHENLRNTVSGKSPVSLSFDEFTIWAKTHDKYPVRRGSTILWDIEVLFEYLKVKGIS